MLKNIGFVKKNVYCILLRFIGSLASMAKFSSFTSYISLSNQPCTTRPTHFDLNTDYYNQGSRCCLFMTNLDRCNRSCDQFDCFSRVHYVGYVNLRLFNFIIFSKEVNSSSFTFS